MDHSPGPWQRKLFRFFFFAQFGYRCLVINFSSIFCVRLFPRLSATSAAIIIIVLIITIIVIIVIIFILSGH